MEWKAEKPKEIWMYVTGDKYELPIYIADSKKELAEMVGTTTLNINCSLCNFRKGKIKYKRYDVVVIDDE